MKKLEKSGIQVLNGVGRITYVQNEFLNTIEGEFTDGLTNGWNRWISCCMRGHNEEISTFVYQGMMKDCTMTKYTI